MPLPLFRRPARIFFQIIGVLTVIGLLGIMIAAMALPRLLQVEDPIQKAEYILPLAGNWHRMIKAAELYKAGYAPRILLSNAVIRPPNRIDRLREEMGIQRLSPRVFRKRLMFHLGIPEEALIAFGDGHISTTEESEAFKHHLKEQKTNSRSGTPRRVILVTSPFHTRRAKMIFEATMPDINFMMTSPPEGKLKAQWWRDQRSAQLAVSEGFKIAFYLLGGSFHSTITNP
jgi:uncharacterized SAM-binding protein YcdF (DUF218 family)